MRYGFNMNIGFQKVFKENIFFSEKTYPTNFLSKTKT